MGWTYQDYINQPLWFIDILGIKLSTEAEYEKDSSKSP